MRKSAQQIVNKIRTSGEIYPAASTDALAHEKAGCADRAFVSKVKCGLDAAVKDGRLIAIMQDDTITGYQGKEGYDARHTASSFSGSSAVNTMQGVLV